MKLATIAILALAVTAPKPPEISDKLKKDFFKAQIAMREAQERMSAAQKAMQDSVAAMQAVCGADNQPTLDATGEPACVAKVKAEKK